MSDAYEIKGVTITPNGGGFYTLTHASLPAEGIKERGKEAAEAKAEQVAEEAASDGTLAPQPDLSALVGSGPLDPLLASVPVEPGTSTPAPVDSGSAEMQTVLAELASLRETNAKLAAQLETRTVADAGAADDTPAVPATTYAPSEYVGVLDDARKAELKRLGLETTDIVLEESENIPPTGLFVGHNGRGYMIKPGETVTVPNFLLGVLDDAVMSSPVTDSTTMKVLGYRNRSRYPYRIAK